MNSFVLRKKDKLNKTSNAKTKYYKSRFLINPFPTLKISIYEPCLLRRP